MSLLKYIELAMVKHSSAKGCLVLISVSRPGSRHLFLHLGVSHHRHLSLCQGASHHSSNTLLLRLTDSRLRLNNFRLKLSDDSTVGRVSNKNARHLASMLDVGQLMYLERIITVFSRSAPEGVWALG